jgi:hypothetical protein
MTEKEMSTLEMMVDGLQKIQMKQTNTVKALGQEKNQMSAQQF